MAGASEAELRARGAARRRWLALDRTSFGAALLGSATVAAYAPLYLYPLSVLTLAMLVGLWHRAPTARRAAALGWWFGLGFFLTGVSWIYVSLHTFGAMPAPIAAFTTLLFCAYLALFPAAAGYAYAAVRAASWVKLTLLTPAVWTLTEWIRGWLFTGFPWLAIGYSQVPVSPLAGYAPIVGVYGLTLATVFTAAAIVLLADRARAGHDPHAHASAESLSHAVSGALRHPALLVLAALWLVGYGLKHVHWTKPVGEPTSVALLQGNIPQEIKFQQEGLRATFSTYRRLALSTDAKLVVFPETALPLFLDEVPRAYLDSLADHAKVSGSDMLVGAVERLPDGEYFNSVISLGSSPAQVYRKTHLVPFGEFIPLRPVLGWVVSVLAIPLQDFSRGTPHPKPLSVAGQLAAINVCYEDAFGEEIIRQLPEATVLVNVSNVAWFGHSIAPRQHLQISQTRALETGRYMLRATNTGMTAIIDDRGHIVRVAPQFETAALTGTLQGHTGTTPYVRWGNALVLAISLAMLAGALLIARRRVGRESR